MEEKNKVKQPDNKSIDGLNVTVKDNASELKNVGKSIDGLNVTIKDNSEHLMLVAETMEGLTNALDRNTKSATKPKPEINQDRIKELEKRLADAGNPVQRYSEKVETVVQSQPVNPVPAPLSQDHKPEKPKIVRKQDPEMGFTASIASAGKTFAASVVQAGTDFGKSMADQIGSEIFPFYGDMKAAASKVVSGTVEAGKIVKSNFERKVVEKKEKKASSVVPQSIIDRTDKIERTREIREKIVERKREHDAHKTNSILDDIRDKLRMMMLINLVKSVGGLAADAVEAFTGSIGKFAGMFGKGGVILAFFAALKKWGLDFGKSSIKGIADAFSKIGSGIKETFSKAMEATKKGFDKLFGGDKDKVKKANPNSPDIQPDKAKTEMKQKIGADGKPVMDKNGKPVFEKVETVEKSTVKTVEKSAVEKAGKKVAIEGAEKGAEIVGKRGAAAVAGRAVGAGASRAIPFIGAFLMMKDAIELLLAAFGKTPEDVGKWVQENTSMPEVNNAQTGGTGVKTMASGAPDISPEELSKLDADTQRRVQEREDRRTQALMSRTGVSNNNVNNNTVVNNTNAANTPNPYVSDSAYAAAAMANAKGARY
ncbi:MAG TPA: hypothetical protein VEZ91_09885 [Kurthia gibsonii]|nr:hypothetical protein [Kurthia gibsonii]